MSGYPVRPDPDSQPFWDAAASGMLVGQACAECGRFRWPPREHCSHCYKAAPVWHPLDGLGTVLGAVVLHRPFDAAFADHIPLMIAHVEIDGTEGQMVLIGNLEPAMPVDRAVGSRVGVTFKERAGARLPTFVLYRED